MDAAAGRWQGRASKQEQPSKVQRAPRALECSAVEASCCQEVLSMAGEEETGHMEGARESREGRAGQQQRRDMQAKWSVDGRPRGDGPRGPETNTSERAQVT